MNPTFFPHKKAGYSSYSCNTNFGKITPSVHKYNMFCSLRSKLIATDLVQCGVLNQ